jgi:predicted metal-dependent peptidase
MLFLDYNETNKILRALEKYHIVFAKIFEFGYVKFDTSVKTACLKFNKASGKPFEYVFNPIFWDSIDFETKIFIIKHETAHNFLRHGERGRQILAMGGDKTTLNIAMDISINHMLVDMFGVDRSLINNGENYCWVETCFPNKSVSSNLNFESYFDLLNEQKEDENDGEGEGEPGENEPGEPGQKGSSSDDSQSKDESESDKNGEFGKDGEPSMGGNSEPELVDDHDFLDEETQEKVDKVLDSIKKSISPESLKDFNNILQQCGDGPGGELFEVEVPKLKPNMKWLNLVKKFKYKNHKPECKIKAQFVFKNRRMTLLNPTNLMPQEYEVFEENNKKDVIDVFCFLDISSSCKDYVNHFLLASKTFPEDSFRVRMFVFDTVVTEIDAKNPKIRVGGGTNFGIIEQKIQHLCKLEECAYPSVVIVITDGEGTKVNPEHPDRWQWMLINKNNYEARKYNYIPSASRIFELKDYFDAPSIQKQLRKL